jgi:uncharacterized protein
MTALDPTADGTHRSGAQVEEVVEEVTVAEVAATGPLAGDPAILGLPSFIVGSVALGLALVGVTPATAVGAPLAIILAATAAGLTIAAIWAAAIGASAVAGIFGIFAGFWLSYAVLVVGLLHNWFGIGLTAVVDTEKLFLITWLIIIVMLTLATLRLPLAFTAVFVLIDVALLLLFINTIHWAYTCSSARPQWPQAASRSHSAGRSCAADSSTKPGRRGAAVIPANAGPAEAASEGSGNAAGSGSPARPAGLSSHPSLTGGALAPAEPQTWR